jgi:hypothetical protein
VLFSAACESPQSYKLKRVFTGSSCGSGHKSFWNGPSCCSCRSAGLESLAKLAKLASLAILASMASLATMDSLAILSG